MTGLRVSGCLLEIHDTEGTNCFRLVQLVGQSNSNCMFTAVCAVVK